MNSPVKKTIRKIESITATDGSNIHLVIVDGKDVLMSTALYEAPAKTDLGLAGTPLEDWIQGIQEQVEGLKAEHQAHSFTVCEDISWDRSDTLLQFLRPLTEPEQERYDAWCERQKEALNKKKSKIEVEERKRLSALLRKYPDMAVKKST